ncbi:MAG: hypothetical protein H0X66_17625 [Verrucomicrobia bacterium]|nr:hypothetical protein [Verrucomicrobiota bacterium]
MNNDEQNVSLPENLKRQFASLEQRLWKVETAQAVSCAAIALFISYLILFFSDRIWDSPVWFRTLIFVAGVLVAVFAVLRWAKVWVLKRRDWRDLSVLVQRKFRRLGDRLLGIVELSAEKKHLHNYSRELYEAAIHQVAEEADKYNFVEAVESRRTKRLGIIAVALLALLLLPLAVVPAASWNVMQRWSVPFADIERYTLVQIAELPERIMAPHGEAFQLDAKVSYRSFWQPRRASARFTKHVAAETSVKNEQASFQIPGQTQNGVLKIKVGDAERLVRIEPSYRPSLQEMGYTIHLPDYLKYPPIDAKVRGSSITLLENSHISFRGVTTRDLIAAEANDGKETTVLEVKSNEFSTAFFNADLAARISFFWQDTVGLSNASPWRVSLVKEKDRSPIPDMPQLSREIAILQTDVLDIRTIARDDYGVRDIGLSWEIESSAEETASWSSTEVKMSKNSSREKEVEELFRWSPGIFRIPADSYVELVAFATDHFPGRERSESAVRRISVLGNERHAELVRQNLESVLARIEEVARKQEQVMAKTEDLQNAENLTPKVAEEKIGKVANEQAQNAKQLDQLSREGMQALREALKNPVFTPQALQEWSKTLQQMQELSQGKMNEAGKDLKSAQQKSGDPDGREQQLGQAQKKIEEILKELEELQGKVNKGLDDLQALTLSERLRKLGETEELLRTELKKIIPETIGLLAKELPDKFRRIESKMAKSQDNVHKEAQNLHREVNRFHERTQKENYGDVGKEMTETRLAEELDRTRELVENNVGMEATRNLAVWSKRFADWADKLQPPVEESSSGQGQGEGEGEGPNMTKTLIALLRLREREMNLHRQTTLLEEQKSAAQDYKAQADELRVIQQKIKEGIAEIEQDNKLPMLKQPYQETQQAMKEVERYLEVPQTDAVTAEAQVKTVELLTDVINLINEQAKRNPPPSGSSEGQESQDMAFLMQMMSQPGMGQGLPSQQGGGNMSGGSTDRAAAGNTADGTGKGADGRKVNKASGSSGVNVPTEFRETLENYFKALEQEESR